MNRIAILLSALLLVQRANAAESPVSVTIDTQSRTHAVRPDFIGVSIFTGTQVHDHKGLPGNLFSGTNSQLITLFKNSGIHHLRLGATGSSASGSQNLEHGDIDALFAFAKATDLRVIYSLHGPGAAETAEYIWKNYRDWLDAFAFDNEPDGRVDEPIPNTEYTNYYADWRGVVTKVRAVVPEAKFAGPDAAGRSLVKQFVKNEKDCDCLAIITQHTYIGGNPVKKGIDAPHAIEMMLSEKWVTENYPQLYRSVLKPLAKDDLPYRLTELDDFTHGATNASDTFAAALWALDAAHWWAEHGARGVNFQNTEWLTTDTFYRDAAGNYQVHPKAYGLKAFELGSGGSVERVEIENTNEINLTAYAVGDATNTFVTIINKEHGADARSAEVTLSGLPSDAQCKTIFLKAPAVDAKKDVTLGGVEIKNDVAWGGKWSDGSFSAKGGMHISLSPISAVVLKISR